MYTNEQLRAEEARVLNDSAAKSRKLELLTTKEVATLTGFSESYFEKARIYGYGPTFLRVRSTGRTGKILYRRAAVDAWLAAQECDPEARNYDR
jgi:predicted DNA-binding transcriptional regulator AlpA